MMSWLAPPVFPDAALTQKALVFHRIAWVVLVFGTAMLGSVFAISPQARGLAARSLAVILVVCPILLELNRRGRTRLAGGLLIGALVMRVAFTAHLSGGIRSPGMGSLLIFVIMGELLLGGIGSVLTATACALIALGYAWAEHLGALPAPTVQYGPLTTWMIGAFYLVMAIVLSRLAAKGVRDALARAESELEVRTLAEKRLTQALDAGAIAVWEQDPKTGTFRGDDRAFALLGLPVSADHTLTLESWQARVHPEDLPSAMTALSSVVVGAPRAEAFYRIVRPDGTVRHMRGAAERVADEQGRLLRVMGMVMDVTDEKRLLRDYGERIKELTALKDATALLLSESLSVPELLQALAELLPPAFEHPGSAQARIRYGRTQRETSGFRETAWRLTQDFSIKDGEDGRVEVVYLEAHPERAIGPFLLEERQLLEAITRMLRTALERRRAREALAESEVRYRGIVETSDEAILIVDKAGKITFVNRKMCALTGYEAKELVGQFGRLLIFPEDLEAVSKRRDRRQATGQVDLYDLNLRRKDGKAVPMLVSASVVRDENGTAAGSMAMMTDMSARNRLQAELQQTQKIDAMGRLSGGVAHDFNNLLTAILGFSELVKMTFKPSDPRHDDMQQVIDIAKRAASLTRQLLAFSRKQALQPVAVDLNDIVRNMEKMLRRLIREDIRLETRLDPGLGLCRADRGQMEQVLLNLTVNARDALPQNGLIAVTTSMADLDEADASAIGLQAGLFVRLEVADTGIGMSEEVQDRIFEPFFTTKPAGQGTGLGLSTVHGIVKQSGGGLRVTSTLGKGSTFEVFLPRVDRPGPAKTPAARRARTRTGGETILLVDDDAGIRVSTKRVLNGAGYRVLEASGGEAALKLLQDAGTEIHLLITDIVMPMMGGSDLAAEACRLKPGLRVLYISGYLDRELPAAAGVRTAYLQKPFAAEDITGKVDEVLSAVL